MAAMPSTVVIQGMLADGDNIALTGTRVWNLQYYDAETGSNALSGEIAVSNTGRWSLSVAPPESVIGAEGDVLYELGIDPAATPDGAGWQKRHDAHAHIHGSAPMLKSPARSPSTTPRRPKCSLQDAS